MTALTLLDTVAGQLAYHLCRAAELTSSGRHAQAVPETILAWALLRHAGGAECAEVMGRADLPVIESARGARVAEAWLSARDLALELTAHFASDHQSELASLYQQAAGLLEREAKRRG